MSPKDFHDDRSGHRSGPRNDGRPRSNDGRPRGGTDRFGDKPRWNSDRPRQGDRSRREDRPRQGDRSRQGDRRGRPVDTREDKNFEQKNSRPPQYARDDFRAPPIPDDITGRELDKAARSELRGLSKENAERVSQHLVAAGRLLDTEPELAYLHAQAAVRRGGRIAAVREALGIVAYTLEKYDEAVRELRTHRRLSGSTHNIAVLADAERGRGKPDKAIEMLAEFSGELPEEGRVELVLVVAGAYADKGDIEAARKLLDAENLLGRPSGQLVRLQSAYSDLLDVAGEHEEAAKWEQLARHTAKSADILFGDEERDPNEDIEIYDLADGDDSESDNRRGSDSRRDFDKRQGA